MSCIHDENVQVLVDEVDVTERWKEHFRGLYEDMERTDQEVRIGDQVIKQVEEMKYWGS